MRHRIVFKLISALTALAIAMAPFVPCSDEHPQGRQAAADLCLHADDELVRAERPSVPDDAAASPVPCNCTCHFPIVASQAHAVEVSALPEAYFRSAGVFFPDGLPHAIFQPPRLLA